MLTRTHDTVIAKEYVEIDPFTNFDVRALQVNLARAQALIRVQKDQIEGQQHSKTETEA